MKYVASIVSLLVLLIAAGAFAQHLVQTKDTHEPDRILDDWMTITHERISASEYNPSMQSSDYKGTQFPEPRLHFANRTHNLRLYFDDESIVLMPRIAQGTQPWNIEFGLKSTGCVANPKITNNKIMYENNNVVLEFANSPTGIEQKVIILKKPSGQNNLSTKMKIGTQGIQCSRRSNDELTFSNEQSTLTYRVLTVEDENQRALRSSIKHDDQGYISFSVQDENAIYPIHMKILISSNNENSISGPGSYASVLRQDPDWSAESDQAYANFGFSVSDAGDVNGDGYSDVIVGAHAYDNGQAQEGRVFVYHGSSSGLTQDPVWIAESDQAYAYFGSSVSSAGDVNGDGYSDVIIGAYAYDNGQTNEGRAFVYHGSNSGIIQNPSWTAESDQAYANFGQSVSSAGDVNGDGYSDVIVGAYQFDNGQTNEGRAFVYHGSITGLAQTPDWTAESDQVYANFGFSVSDAGDVNGDGYSDVIVGAYQFGNGQANEGRAFVYHGSITGLAQTPDWTAESDQGNARFGWSVSSAGDVNGDGYSDVIVGAYSYDNGQADEGRVFVYHGGSSGLTQEPIWTAESNQGNAFFGCSVSSAGDVNASGFSDVIIGAYLYDIAQVDEGVAFVYPGCPTGLLQTPCWSAGCNQNQAYFGWSVSSAGDVNGDGYTDVIVGAYSYDNGETNEGAAFAYHSTATPLHNIMALNMVEPSDEQYPEFSTIHPSAAFMNTGIYQENNIPVTFLIKLDDVAVYTSTIIIDSLAQQADTLIVFDDFTLGTCGSHYQAVSFSNLPADSYFVDDTVGPKDFAAARMYELTAPGCDAWKYPNADSGYVPNPNSAYWIAVTQQEVQQISALDSMWWVTAGALDEAHQDLQLYGIQFDVPDTMIEAIAVEWWGHHGEQIHHACGMYFWNHQTETWSQRVDTFNVNEDVLIQCTLPTDSVNMFVSSSAYMYAAVGADYNEVACCPLLFTHNEKEDIFIGDIIVGCDLGMWVDRVLGNNFYVPPDYDEYVKINGEYLENVDGKYYLTVNEMLQEVSYLDEVSLYVVDHPADYDVFPQEALIYPGYQGLSIYSSQESSLRAATDEQGYDILHTLEAIDRIYAPFEKSGITGFTNPFTITLDVGELEDSSSAVLFLFGSTRFQDSDEVEPASDIYHANKRGMKLRNPTVEVVDASGRWKKVSSCGMPRGHKKTITYPLYDQYGKTIFKSSDHRLRITIYTEVYLDKAWVSCHTADDFRTIELKPEVAELHYYGYADYRSHDDKYPGEYYYGKKGQRDYANVAGYYTKYGNVLPLLDAADSKFVIMCHGDEISLEFGAQKLPKLPDGWKRDFVFATKGFYKMARPGRAYAYSVDPLPFYGMREDMSANGVGYYPYDPGPNLLASLLGRVYGKIVFDYPFSLSDALTMIKAHLTGKVKDKYPEELTAYCQEWNTRHVGAYYPDCYADAPPHLNLEKVPLYEDEGEWPTHLASLGIPFGDHSLHSNYVRVLLVTTVPIGTAEHKIESPMEFVCKIGHPNPFREFTAINYSIASPVCVRVTIYDVTGRLVRTLTDDVQQPGSYQLTWDGTDDSMRRCAAGAYCVKIAAGKHKITKKLISIR